MLAVIDAVPCTVVDAPRIEHVPSLVVVTDAASARLIALMPGGREEDVLLRPDAPRGFRPAAWMTLVEAVYRPHVADYRGRHVDAVAQAVAAMAQACEVEAIILAGDPRSVEAFRTRLPSMTTDHVVGSIPGTPGDSSRELAERARRLLRRLPCGTGVAVPGQTTLARR